MLLWGDCCGLVLFGVCELFDLLVVVCDGCCVVFVWDFNVVIVFGLGVLL